MIKGNLIKNIKYIKTNMNVIKRWNIMSSDGSDFQQYFTQYMKNKRKKKCSKTKEERKKD